MDRKTEALKAFIAIKRNNELIEGIAREDVRQNDLNLNEFGVLELLYHKGPQTVQQVKERILIASSSTTYIIDKLCKKGFVERKFDEADRRVIYVSITDQGYKLVEEIWPRHAQTLVDSFENLTTEEIYQLRQLLKKMSHLDK